MYWSLSTLAFLGFVAPSFQAGGGVLRFGCAQLVVERLDPLVEPSASPSQHMHQIVGGNAFAASMPLSDISNLTTCTTCQFSEDFSNYWTANMYFKARNGSYKRVSQKPNRFLQGANAGITVYYVAPYNGAKVTAFKPGFRMIVGDASLRNQNGMPRTTCFRCYTGPNFQGDNDAPCSDPKLDTRYLPKSPCLGGIRSNIQFPTCWDGKNLDSPDHKSHVSYPSSGSFETSGPCPATHPVKLPQIFLEVVWDTTEFNDKSLWPTETDAQPFVLSMSDETGFGQHADYVFGWKGDALQRAMENPKCVAATCPDLKSQTFTEANKCTLKQAVNEPINGWIASLPGYPSGM